MFFAVSSICANAQIISGITPFGVSVGTANVCAAGQSTPAPCSATATVTFEFTRSVSIAAPAVFTEGTANLDFTDEETGTCTTNGTSHVYAIGDTCTVNVKFAPLYPGLRRGAVWLVDARSGFASPAGLAYVYGTGVGPQLVFSSDHARRTNSFVSTIGPWVYVDGIGDIWAYVQSNPTSGATLNEYRPSATSSGYNFHLYGQANFTIDGAGNDYSTCAENSCPDDYGDQDYAPWGLFFLAYDPGATSWILPSRVGSFAEARGVATDGAGDVFFGDASATPDQVKEIPVGCSSDACVINLGGSFSQVSTLAMDSAGDVFVTDVGAGTVSEILAAGGYTTVNMLASGLNQPTGISVDPAGNVFFVEYGAGTLKEITAASGYATVRVLADDLYQPNGVGMDGLGNVYVRTGDNMIKFWFSAPPDLSFADTDAGSISADSPERVFISNNGTGSQAINLSAVSYPTDFPEAPGATSDCSVSSSTALAPGQECTVTVNFAPQPSSITTLRTSLSENITLSDDLPGGGAVTIPASGVAVGFSAPALTSPGPGSTLESSSVTFRWTAAGSPTSYLLKLSADHFGGSDVFGGFTSATSITAPSIPENGATLYAQLSYKFKGAWIPINYTYLEAGSPTPPVMTSPAPGSTTGSSATFMWSPGAGPTRYILKISTVRPGSWDVFKGETTGTSLSVPSLPTGGGTLFVQLSYNASGTWVAINYTYTETGTPSPPSMYSPVPGTTFSSGTVTFKWQPGNGVTRYRLLVGTLYPGSHNLPGPYYTSGTSSTLNLPSYGAAIYITLQYKTLGVWYSIDYTYKESGKPEKPAITSPVPGSQLTASSTTFTWFQGDGPTAFRLRVGIGGPGSSDIYLGPETTSTFAGWTSELVTGLPTDGTIVYVTLGYKLGPNDWHAVSYSYPDVPPAMISPSPGSTLTGSSATFTWTTGIDTHPYKLLIGSSPGAGDIYSPYFGFPSGVTSQAVTNLPTNGQTLYVTLQYELENSWYSVPYTYTAYTAP